MRHKVECDAYNTPIIVYKRGSRGEVYTEYANLNELVHKEVAHSKEPLKRVHSRFYQTAIGRAKHSKCFHLGYDITIRVKRDVR
jgi:hypothetical protein